MSNNDKKKLHSYMCEICNINPASELKGGLNGIHKLWFICKQCIIKIEDTRTEERRKH